MQALLCIHPRSNGRAEVAVKAMKHLLQDIITVNGDLDSYTRAVLQYRITPDPDNGIHLHKSCFVAQYETCSSVKKHMGEATTNPCQSSRPTGT